MRKEMVEIFSDASNAAVLRHPGRQFPGVLVQGDTLHILCQNVDSAINNAGQDAPLCEDLLEIRDVLFGLRKHYKLVLQTHDIQLPYSE